MTTIRNGERYGKSGVRISLTPSDESEKTCKARPFEGKTTLKEKLRRGTGVIAARLVYFKCRVVEFIGG